MNSVVVSANAQLFIGTSRAFCQRIGVTKEGASAVWPIGEVPVLIGIYCKMLGIYAKLIERGCSWPCARADPCLRRTFWLENGGSAAEHCWGAHRALCDKSAVFHRW